MKGVDVFLESFWREGEEALESLQKNQFQIITATNVLAHNTNPKEFLRLAAYYLDWEGIMVLEFPYARDLVLRNEFDTIYHEHASYFLANSLWKLLDDTGLYVRFIHVIEVHGGSLRIILARCHPGQENKYHSGSLSEIISTEKKLGLHTLHHYNLFTSKVQKLRQDVIGFSRRLVAEKRTLCGFGASGKSSVFLSYTGLPLSFIVDETPAKVGKFSPGSQIPIKELDAIQFHEGPLDIFIFAWNCLAECLDKLRSLRNPKQEDTFITYVPSLDRSPLHTL